MKKLLLVMLAATLLSACGRQEKLTLEQALLEKMQADSDLKDYKIDPKDMTGCVLDEIAQSLPVMPVDSQRGAYFDAYAKFITANNPMQAINDAVPLFGSVQASRKAAMNVTEFVISCMGRLMDKYGPEERDPAQPRAVPTKPQPAP